MELSEQALPEDSHCPNCGQSPSDESIVEHRLSNNGYLHDDVKLECSACGEEWTHGVPIGQELEYGDDLWCDSCDDSVMLVHRARVLDSSKAYLDLKCPNCKYYKSISREGTEHPTDGDVFLVGYPQLTGEMEGAEEYGYRK